MADGPAIKNKSYWRNEKWRPEAYKIFGKRGRDMIRKKKWGAGSLSAMKGKKGKRKGGGSYIITLQSHFLGGFPFHLPLYFPVGMGGKRKEGRKEIRITAVMYT